MSTFTSSLPDKLLQEQLIASMDYKMLKNMSIEMELEIYLEQLDRAVYLDTITGSEQSNRRPSVIISGNLKTGIICPKILN